MDRDLAATLRANGWTVVTDDEAKAAYLCARAQQEGADGVVAAVSNPAFEDGEWRSVFGYSTEGSGVLRLMSVGFETSDVFTALKRRDLLISTSRMYFQTVGMLRQAPDGQWLMKRAE